MKEKITKKFGILQGISLSFGIIIGIGIYFKTPSLLAVTGNNALLGLLAWIIGFIFIMFWSFTTAEYAGTVTETGGCLSYVRETAGDLPAFIMGWGLFLVGNPALVAVLSSVAAGFIMDIFGWSGIAVNCIITLIIVVGCFVLNTVRAEGGGKFQSIMTIVKVIPLIALILFGLFGRNGGYLGESLSRPIQLESGTVLTALIAAIVPVIFSFSGWDHVANVAAEMENPTKTVPKAIIISTIASAVVYIAIYLAFINAMPVEQVADNIPFGIATTMFGSMGAKILMACIVLSAVGACNGVIISTMRNPYSLAIKKLFIFPEFFAKIDEKTQVPLNSTILMFIICIIHVVIYETGIQIPLKHHGFLFSRQLRSLLHC